MLPERKTIRLDHSRYQGRRIYFLTFCCEERRRVFADTAQAVLMILALKRVSEAEGFRVHAYCVMMDHVHVVAEGSREESDVVRFVKAFKQLTAFHYKAETGGRLWQKKYYDHILRAADSLNAVVWYVWLNPVRAGLCADARSYPHSGSMTMDWNGKPKSDVAWAPPWKSQDAKQEEERT
jgi:putative transposase